MNKVAIKQVQNSSTLKVLIKTKKADTNSCDIQFFRIFWNKIEIHSN